MAVSSARIMAVTASIVIHSGIGKWRQSRRERSRKGHCRVGRLLDIRRRRRHLRDCLVVRMLEWKKGTDEPLLPGGRCTVPLLRGHREYPVAYLDWIFWRYLATVELTDRIDAQSGR